jgi:hypothetical protein
MIFEQNQATFSAVLLCSVAFASVVLTWFLCESVSNIL